MHKPWRLQSAGHAAALVSVVAVICGSGCVQRRLTIRSNPPGALVYIDNQEIGTTPVSTDYIYYGTRTIELVKDGYETVTVAQPIPAPWFEWFPLDFVSENVFPGEIRDDRTFSYDLPPRTMVPTDQLLARADQLRAANRSSGLPAAGVSDVAPPAENIAPPPMNVQPAPVYSLPAPEGNTPLPGVPAY